MMSQRGDQVLFCQMKISSRLTELLEKQRAKYDHIFQNVSRVFRKIRTRTRGNYVFKYRTDYFLEGGFTSLKFEKRADYEKINTCRLQNLNRFR